MKTSTMDPNERAWLSQDWTFYLTTGAFLLILLSALMSRNKEEIAKALWLLGGWLISTKGAIKKSHWIQGAFFVSWLGGYILGLPYAFHGRITWGDVWPFAVGGMWVLLLVALMLLGAGIWALWNSTRPHHL